MAGRRGDKLSMSILIDSISFFPTYILIFNMYYVIIIEKATIFSS